jgi:hypothetical protein
VAGGDGLSFNGYPKESTPRQSMLQKLKTMARKMDSPDPIEFSQLPKVRQSQLSKA